MPPRRPISKFLLLVPLLVTGCGGGGGSSGAAVPTVCVAPCTVTVAWDPNLEAAVNATGGGYRVHYAETSGLPMAQTQIATVSYDPVTNRTPTSAELALAAGTWYVRVVAFADPLNPAGSAPSPELTVRVP